MKRDVSGPRPWVGAPERDWSEYRIELEGHERPGRWAMPSGTVFSEDGRYVYAFARVETPAGHSPRRAPRELVIDRVTVGGSETGATLVAEWPGDALRLEIGDERRQSRLRMLLRALPLLQDLPRVGRPLGSRQREDAAELRRRIGAAVVQLRAEGRRLSWNTVADVIDWEPSTLRKKAQSYGITHPSLLP